ncbi:MAG: isoleucine--tRNA ligase [Fimbriimonadaceae bacterium]|nr:isoleucine--tRNA ligase [Fimbriimonadaceae bacterium]
MDLRETLNLPDAAFTIPMKANLPSLEPEIQARWDEIRVYHLIQQARKDAPTFVLHDGPPYTNSPTHLGTALNKILKDIVVKSRTLMGYRAPYVPGYDNHGLPIEQAVMKEFEKKGVRPDVPTLREACRSHAKRYLDVQTEQFKRLGVFGLWERPYVTMDFRFEAEIVRVFKRMVERGFVYRGLRSVQWSPTSRTALADTEIVYRDHVSKAVYVRFPVMPGEAGTLGRFSNLHTIIWTTTPWTIPANVAVALHPLARYVVARFGEDHYLLAEDLLGKVADALGWDDYDILAVLSGEDVAASGVRFKHPVFDRESVVVLAEYVTMEDGTGVVHTAPGHGREDFETGTKYGLPVLCPVDERGFLTAEAGEFAGTYYQDCDRVVVERLRELGNLLLDYDFPHQYPYGERDGRPIIFRATEQWFVSIDHRDLRDQMLEEIPKVAWYPPSGEQRIRDMIAKRPDWCISRQRPWGVGIPVFYGKESGKPVLDPMAIEAVAQLVEREGSDAWFVREPKDILPVGYTDPETGETEFTKETDVLDVWFDSGSTSLAVLEGNVDPAWKEPWPADLYLEGSDQHRGWFNTSLILGTAIREDAPYRAVLTHGFVTDEKGFKMSKRGGNAVDPVEASDKFGADILRYWVASVDYTFDVPCSENLLRQIGDGYRRIRNTLRFLLSNLYDFDPSVSVELLDLDRWVIEQTDLLVADCLDAYRRYDFGKVITGVHNFCADELSSFYLDAIKDRMYCDGKDWPSRRSGQIACHYVLERITKLVAPILAHTAEEVYARIPASSEFKSIHLEVLDAPDPDRLEAIEGSEFQTRFARILEVRRFVFSAFEEYKAGAESKDSQDAVAVVTVEPEVAETLRGFGEDLAIYLKVSEAIVLHGERSATFRPSEHPKCERSRLRRRDVTVVNDVPLTARDRRALGW